MIFEGGGETGENEPRSPQLNDGKSACFTGAFAVIAADGRAANFNGERDGTILRLCEENDTICKIQCVRAHRGPECVIRLKIGVPLAAKAAGRSVWQASKGGFFNGHVRGIWRFLL